MVKKKGSKFLRYTGKSLLFLLKTPYYLGKGACFLVKKTNQEIKKRKVEMKRTGIKPCFDEFEIVKKYDGDYSSWIDGVHASDSKVGVILGARGSGKTAFGIKFLENVHAKYNKKCYAIGFHEAGMPSWINVISDVSQLGNNAFVLIDEGGILFNSRDSMSNANKLLSELILIARHKNLSILFISQNSSNLDVNILRQADFLILKPSSLLQKEFERKIIQKIYDDAKDDFEVFKDREGLAFVYSDGFRGFVSNPLPSFWRTEISKSFR